MNEINFKDKYEEVGVGWKNENSISLKVNVDLYQGDRLLVIDNKNKTMTKHPDFNLFRERKFKMKSDPYSRNRK